MTERRLGDPGDADAALGPTPSSSRENASPPTESATATGPTPAATIDSDSEAAAADRVVREPGQSRRGDDDWNAIGGAEAMGPADAPSGSTEPGGD